MTYKQFVKLLIPPVLVLLGKRLFTVKGGLFLGRDASLFLDNAYNAKVYGEYGVGYSTLSIRQKSDAVIISVETNFEYMSEWKKNLYLLDDDNLFHENIGIIVGWGYPNNYALRKNFIDYFESIWKFDKKPDFVLIDGRFRVAYFLTSLVLSEPGTLILFDDYDREYYHVVEEVLLPNNKTVTQALFITPKTLNKTKILYLRDLFSNVMV